MSLERNEGNDLGCLRFTWANGTRNPVLANSVRESRLPVAQIRPIYRKRASEALN